MNYNVSDESIGRIREPIPVADDVKKDESTKIDSGLSSIEKSKSVKPDIFPMMNIPVLSVPSNMDSVAFAVASVDASGKPMVNTITSLILKSEAIKGDVLKGWIENLKEIAEHVRQLLSSPLYQQLQEFRQKGMTQVGAVSGVQEPNISGRPAESVNFLTTLDRLQTMERLPSTAEVFDSSAPKDSSQVLILPLTAAFLAGGLVIGTEVSSAAAHPLSGIFEIVERLQPIIPQVSIQDIIPLINLMVVAPIYFNSWNDAVSNIKSRERHNYIQTVQNFAKDVIKIVNDQDFVNTLISRMKGTNQLTRPDQIRLACILKVLLIGVALSLLYSVEVGKVQNGKFAGIEPEELRDLILGRFHKRTNKKVSDHEKLILNLIDRAREQLSPELTPFSEENRLEAVNILVDYITQPRDLDHLLDPAKVFDSALSSFDPKENLDSYKA